MGAFSLVLHDAADGGAAGGPAGHGGRDEVDGLAPGKSAFTSSG